MRLQLNILYARVNSDLSISHSHKPRLLTNTYLVGWCISGYEISHKCSIGGPLTTFCFYYHWKQLGSNCCLTHVQRSQKRHIHVPLLHCIYTLFLPHFDVICVEGERGWEPRRTRDRKQDLSDGRKWEQKWKRHSLLFITSFHSVKNQYTAKFYFPFTSTKV